MTCACSVFDNDTQAPGDCSVLDHHLHSFGSKFSKKLGTVINRLSNVL